MKNYIFIFILFFSSISFSQTNSVIKLDRIADKGYYVEKRYPNPFSPVTYTDFNIPDSSNVIIYILECSNNENKLNINPTDTVIIIYQGILNKGFYRCTWDLLDRNNIKVKSGCYTEYIKAEAVLDIFQQISFVGITKMVLIL
jgi:hypothetical protein